MEEWEAGSTVLICGLDELTSLLKYFSPTLECIAPLTIEEVADQYATLAEILPAPQDFQALGDVAVLLLENGHDVLLPISAFEPIHVKIELLEESADKIPILRPSASVTSHDTTVALTLAAECIQTAFRSTPFIHLMSIPKLTDDSM